MAYLFDNANGHRMNVNSTPVTAAPLTMSCWAKCDDETTANAAFSIGDSTVSLDLWDILFAGNVAGDPIRFRAVDGTAGSADGPVDYVANTWYHVAGVEESATSRYCYVDGVAGAQDTTNRSPDGANRIAIGCDANAGDASLFSGHVAECAIWNVALTAAEIGILALGVPAYMVRPASLVFYAPLVDGTVDEVGGRTSSLLGSSGSPTVSTHPRMNGMPRPHIWEYTPAAPATDKGPLADGRLANSKLLGRLVA